MPELNQPYVPWYGFPVWPPQPIPAQWERTRHVNVFMLEGGVRVVDLTGAKIWEGRDECDSGTGSLAPVTKFDVPHPDANFGSYGRYGMTYSLRAIILAGGRWIMEGKNHWKPFGPTLAYCEIEPERAARLFVMENFPLPAELMGEAQRPPATIGEHLAYLGRDASSTKTFHDLINNKAIEGGPVTVPGQKRGLWWMRVLDRGLAFKKGHG